MNKSGHGLRGLVVQYYIFGGKKYTKGEWIFARSVQKRRRRRTQKSQRFAGKLEKICAEKILTKNCGGDIIVKFSDFEAVY